MQLKVNKMTDISSYLVLHINTEPKPVVAEMRGYTSIKFHFLSITIQRVTLLLLEGQSVALPNIVLFKMRICWK